MPVIASIARSVGGYVSDLRASTRDHVVGGRRELRRRLGERGTGVLIGGSLAAVLLVGTFVGFVAKSSLTAVPLLGFLIVVAVGWNRHKADTVEGLSFLTTVITVGILGLITVYLFQQSLPIFEMMGLEIVTRDHYPFWETGVGRFSLTPMVWGTVMTTLVATAIAAPLGVAGALFISEIAPRWLREFVKPGIEIMAGIPSIVYGFIGFAILNKWMQETNTFDLPTTGSLFVAGAVVGIMALPTVVSVAEDAISSVPDAMKDGSMAMGATDWQTMKSVTVPAAFSGVSAAVLLGVGRAIGETMAATVILGNVTRLPEPLYDAFGNTITLTSAIASQYGNTEPGSEHQRALFAAGVILFVTVMVLSITSQWIERRMQRKLGGKE